MGKIKYPKVAFLFGMGLGKPFAFHMKGRRFSHKDFKIIVNVIGVIFMMGIIWAIIAGATMSLQGVLNTRLGEKTGVLEANAFVQGTAFLLSFLIAWIFGKGDIMALFSTNPVYWFGGLIGVAITVTVMLAMGASSPAVAVSVILVSQLAVAGAIDYFGWFGTEKVPFGINKFIGLAVIIIGIIVYKYK